MKLSLDKTPKFRFAVLSMTLPDKEQDRGLVVLESSFDSEGQAQNMFDRQYSKWGMLDVNFYLVDWEKQSVLRAHEQFSDEFTRILYPKIVKVEPAEVLS